jgi:hypothetical protein
MEDNIIPIKPQHVQAQIKFSGLSPASPSKSSQSGIARNRRLPGQRSHGPGWQCKSVDRNGRYALTIEGHVHTPAEAVELSYNTNGYRSYNERRDKELPILMEQLANSGFTVTPHPRYPNSTSIFIVTKKA